MVENSSYAPATATPAAAKPISVLKRAAARGAAWTFAGYGVRQVLRFGNKMILARLLLPEIFGLMALVDVFVLGLTFFSDIGINLSIVQSERGETELFLDTAWTLQVLRGLLLGLIACLLAWPAAGFFDEPMLTSVLPIAGLTAVFAGFNSTKLTIAQRKLRMREYTLIELASYVLGIVVMVVWAYYHRSVWALVAGNLVTAFTLLMLSHVALPGYNNRRLRLDSTVVQEIWKFGRWILISTALTFLAGQTDRPIVGKLMGLEFLGIYGIAIMLANMVNAAIMQLGYRVFFPSYSSLVRNDPGRLYSVLRQARVALVALNWAGAIFFLLLAPTMIPLLFGENFADAGWMLRILALGTLVGVLSVTYDHVLVAKGQTSAVAALFAIQFVLQLTGLLIGARLGGELGIVVGFACAGWLIYPFKAIWLMRYKLWQPEVDLPAIGGATLIVLGFFFFLY